MIKTLIHLFTSGRATRRGLFPPLPEHSRGMPLLTNAACSGCAACTSVCPTAAITISAGVRGSEVTMDRGLCIACGLCSMACPTSTIVVSRETAVAVRRRQDLMISTCVTPTAATGPCCDSPGRRTAGPKSGPAKGLFKGSIHLREVSTGDSASDLEVNAANNPIFDSSRFGIHFVASPRFADGLLVTGPAPRAMQEPLRRCYEAMPEPRLVIAAGASAISGGIHRGGYASANGADVVLPVSVYIPGSPPHPWSILHGILLAMESPLARPWSDPRPRADAREAPELGTRRPASKGH
jgi:Ni,Fe-hydrogenase III small subunit/ferredoxin